MAEPLKGPPVLILGGDEIALSIARSLAPLGIRVAALSPPDQPIRYSRHAEYICISGGPSVFARKCLEFLTGPRSAYLAGSLLLATLDEGVAMIIENRERLQQKFLLDRSNPEAQRIMLDKVETYLAAREAGVPTPRFWVLKSSDDWRDVASELTFPLIVKPRFGHLFKARFKGLKHFVAHSLPDVEDVLEKMAAARIDVFLVEKIPGPDDLLCSYYTYLDETGKTHFDFTKRIIRRYPKNMGQATYHITDRVRGIKGPALRLFRHVGLQGVANVEFKLDPRDGRYKLIECNARFVGANPLVLKSGVNIAKLVYCQVTDQPMSPIKSFRSGVRLWYPWRDFIAYRQLHRLGDLSFGQWIGSLMHPQNFAVWSWRDPGPAVMPLVLGPARFVRAQLRRMRQSTMSGKHLRQT